MANTPSPYFLLGAFGELKEATLILAMSPFSLPFRVEQFDSHWIDFHEIWYLSIFRKSVEKIQIPLKTDKNNGYFTCRRKYIYNT